MITCLTLVTIVSSYTVAPELLVILTLTDLCVLRQLYFIVVPIYASNGVIE